MIIFITSDSNREAEIHTVISKMRSQGIVDYFGLKNYGNDLIDVSLFLICRDPRYNFKQRIKFKKAEKRLYIDIMFDLYEMINADMETREKIIAHKFLKEIPPIIAKYKFKDFDLLKFKTDLKDWLMGNKMIDRQP